ncbi:serine hydrolase domain-containing protein [Tenggerimyces flavus]|uniref:Serine hydrolase domain-containing protein n=1 Tax=Tenggerimyces flavus TaxID=1708749 RepID=A0ABV7YCV9_9ACTN|nr:serine hydrolase domain-containing protein [Tenggerimyces flavus]MBM7786960.1 CubicO group peptidase (beta-lactamase class C family) [Tenggerimyces flavus]
MINGTSAENFRKVNQAFEANFQADKELGASLAVYHHGRQVVDLWGGYADLRRSKPWERDTLTIIASTTKAMAAIAALLLVDRGSLDLDATVASYWPEFAAEGKGDITLRQLLSHQSGVISLERSPLTAETLIAGTPIVEAIAAVRPEWTPGTAHGYHALTIGHALSEIVRRQTGLTVGQFFATEIAGPYGIDAFIGLPEKELGRLSDISAPDPGALTLGKDVEDLADLFAALNDPTSAAYRATAGSIGVSFEAVNDHRFAIAESPSADGTASAAALAKLFALLVSDVDGKRLLSRAIVDEARTPHASGKDQVLCVRTDWGLGFMLPGGPMFRVPQKGTFGHGGSTGSFAFADPEHELAFAYVPNRMSELLEGSDQRAWSLVDATYASLEG